MKKLMFLILLEIILITSNLVLADFDSDWKNIDSLDKDFLVKDAKEGAKSGISTEELGVKNTDTNAFVNSTPQDQSTLESKGNSAYFSSNETSVEALRSAHDSTNENNPDTQKYLRAADEVVSNTEKMLKANLLDYIKSETGLDINCVPIEGKSHLRDDPYVVGLDKEVVGDPVYEPFFCEKRFNKYDCKDTLHLRCLNFSSKQEGIVVTYANTAYTVDGNGIMSMSKSYQVSNGGYGQTNSGFFSSGSVFGKSKERYINLASTNFELHFNANLDPKIYSEFAILNINYNGMILITLNGHAVFSNPGGITHMNHNGSYDRIYSESKGNVFKNIKYFDHYPIISTNLNNFRLGLDGGKNSSSTASIDLRSYIVKGSNRLILTGFSPNSGYVNLRIRSQERLCLNWLKEWREECVHQKY